MIIEKKPIDTRFLTMGIIINVIVVFNIPYVQGTEQSLQWSIQSNKSAYYPGEPLLLTVNITNSRQQKEKVDFGMDGIEAFSIEVRDSNGITVAAGKKIQRFGFTLNSPFLEVSSDKTSHKSVVLNRWCSTLLQPGLYHVIINVKYRLCSEDQKQAGTRVLKAGPFHSTQLELSIGIIPMDTTKFKEILDTLAKAEVKLENQSYRQWLEQWDTASEMLALTESELAVPYQLDLLKSEQYTWRRRDIINSLVKSSTVDAAKGLTQIMEDMAVYKDDIKYNIVDAVYRLRDTGKPDIISATQGFVAKHKRPTIHEPMD